MKTETFDLISAGGVRLSARLYLPDQTPRRILQITHGMTEHIGRYQAFAQEMTARGTIVAGFDLRGHGRNAGDPHIASLGDGGWTASLQDMRLFYDQLRARFPGLPHYMLGFSLGSFLLREYLSKWPHGIDGAILMGTGDQPALILRLMIAIVRSQIKKSGFDETTDLIRALSFGTYNRKFRRPRTDSDWLCADMRQLDAYLADPYCRSDISSGLFCQLLQSMLRTGAKDACADWDRNMPVLLISGQKDPVGDFGRGVKAVCRKIKKSRANTDGFLLVQYELIPSARHMLLFEESSGAADRARRAIRAFCEVREAHP